MATAETLRLPIVADEVYDGMVFAGETFVPMASVSSAVPVLSVRLMMARLRLRYRTETLLHSLWVCLKEYEENNVTDTLRTTVKKFRSLRNRGKGGAGYLCLCDAHSLALCLRWALCLRSAWCPAGGAAGW